MTDFLHTELETQMQSAGLNKTNVDGYLPQRLTDSAGFQQPHGRSFFGLAKNRRSELATAKDGGSAKNAGAFFSLAIDLA
jgi:hypothetical protein